MAGRKPPPGAIPPHCKCGCGTPVNWSWGHGWLTWARGHQRKGKPGGMLGRTLTPTQRKKVSVAQRTRYAGKRKRDLDPTGPGIYGSHEYKEARAKYVPQGSVCRECRSSNNIHAHHLVPGDDSTLVPLCRACHGAEHHRKPDSIGVRPPKGSVAPLCECGCGENVRWHRGHGWSKRLRGHRSTKL